MEVYVAVKDESLTRAAMVRDSSLTLSIMDAKDKLESEPSVYVQLWIGFLGDWPSVTNQGCHYLLQARDKF